MNIHVVNQPLETYLFVITVMVSTKVGYRLTGFFYQLLVSRHKAQKIDKNEKLARGKSRLSLLAQIILEGFSSD